LIELPLRALFGGPTAVIEQNQARSSDTAALVQTLGEVEAMTEEQAHNLLAT
jgi:hypothetical protein